LAESDHVGGWSGIAHWRIRADLTQGGQIVENALGVGCPCDPDLIVGTNCHGFVSICPRYFGDDAVRSFVSFLYYLLRASSIGPIKFVYISIGDESWNRNCGLGLLDDLVNGVLWIYWIDGVVIGQSKQRLRVEKYESLVLTHVVVYNFGS